MTNRPAILWFRQDLRLASNPAVDAAAGSGRPLVCVYVLDDETPGRWRMGGASRWWLHHSLLSLARDLERIGGQLILRRGNGASVISALVRETDAACIYWNRCYEPYAIHRDAALKQRLTATGVAVHSFNAGLLAEPWEVQTGGGTPFRVFTPFWRALQKAVIAVPLPGPVHLCAAADIRSECLSDWRLLPEKPDWAAGLRASWTPGEAGAEERLEQFRAQVRRYADERDIPGIEATSRLSPHLHFGEICPRRIWHAIGFVPDDPGREKFLAEIAWREFAHHLLYFNPTLPEAPLQNRFENFPWRPDEGALRAWQRGQTGIPIVDAGMRQLWQTGWMHNRVRMIAASFLVKHLLIDWRDGQDWFWDTLVDADLANNAAGWQWVAGCGADAAPYFRVFNPVLQGEKFDPEGAYVRRYVPELASVPARFVHKPWEAGGVAGYPAPIVDLAAGRERALGIFAGLAR